MKTDFTRGSALFKALSDETRLRIAHILSCGELCACDLLTYFELTQPTLSHHMSVLIASEIVEARKEGKWIHYRINRKTADYLAALIPNLFEARAKCECEKIDCSKGEKNG